MISKDQRERIDRLRRSPTSLYYGLTRAQTKRIDAWVTRVLDRYSNENVACGALVHEENR